jgi:nucleoside-diphosphate-sugar epimerase
MVSEPATASGIVSESTSMPLPEHVLIAGCGYLGRRAADRWRRDGVRVSVLTRGHSKAQTLQQAGFEPLTGDLATGLLPPLPPVDTVLWSVGFDRSTGQTREAIWIDGLQHLLKQLPQTVRRFLYVSSTGVYGQSTGETVSESTTPHPTTESGQCCLRAEEILKRAFPDTQREPNLTILRMAGLYGPGRLLRRIADLKAGISLPGQPESCLNLIHIDDAVTAVTELASSTCVPLINVVNSGALTRQEYYSELADLVNVPTPGFDAASTSVRGGNKHVVSELRESLLLHFEFDDVKRGLRDAVERTEGVSLE